MLSRTPRTNGADRRCRRSAESCSVSRSDQSVVLVTSTTDWSELLTQHGPLSYVLFSGGEQDASRSRRCLWLNIFLLYGIIP